MCIPSSLNLGAFALAFTASAQGQCEPLWLDGVGVPGANSSVLAVAWLPSASGGGDVVAGGDFATIGAVAANRIARWDGSSWYPMGPGVSNGLPYEGVTALAVMPNGAGGNNLFAGGAFTVAGGVAANNVARWDGSQWSALGNGTDGHVYALLALPNGELIAGGSFQHAGGVAANNIAKWNGASWTSLGEGLSAEVYTLAYGRGIGGGGRVFAGGRFYTAGGTSARCIAQWDGTMWSPLGSGANEAVWSLVATPNAAGESDIIAGGAFTSMGGVDASNIARWDGAQWHALGSGVNGSFDAVYSLATLPDGAGRTNVIAAGSFPAMGDVPARYIARWNGSDWFTLGQGTDRTVVALTVAPDGTGGSDLVVGGTFTSAGGLPAVRIARFGSPCRCQADLDNGQGFGSTASTKDGAVTIDDLLYFLAAFAIGDAGADLDDGSGQGVRDGAITVDDLTFFLVHFQAGC